MLLLLVGVGQDVRERRGVDNKEARHQIIEGVGITDAGKQERGSGGAERTDGRRGKWWYWRRSKCYIQRGAEERGTEGGRSA